MNGPDDKVTVSVVTPSFNQGEFIEETIQSVLSQAGDFYLDYIIMDGGSTDQTVAIIAEYERLLKAGEWPVQCLGIEYRWVSEKDGGQADAVNKGWKTARGAILGWLNSDDTYLPGAIAAAVRRLTEDPTLVMVYGNAHYTDRAGKVTGSYATEPFRFKRLAQKCFLCQPAVFLRSSVIEEVGPLDASIHTCMDYELWIRIGERFGGRIDFLQEYLATSRMYAENKTMGLRKKVHSENLALLNRYFGYVDGENIAACFYDEMNRPGLGIRSVAANLPNRLFVLKYLLNPRTACSFVSYLVRNLARVLRSGRKFGAVR